MAKRKLTLQQQRRIKGQQDLSRAQADNEDAQITTAQTESGLGSEQSGIVAVRYADSADVVIEAGGAVRRCHFRANLDSLIAGDRVAWRDGESWGVITAVQPRKNHLDRPDNRGKLRPVAANIDRIAIVLAPQPQPHANLIDRYLVASEARGIASFLVLNKSDMGVTEDLTQLLTTYAQLGYPLLFVSAKTGAGMAQLAASLQHKTGVLVGQSGVGKSSLINALIPDAETQTGPLSTKSAATGSSQSEQGVVHRNAKGTHTTSSSQLFRLPGGGGLIDSPGIREFGLWHLDAGQVAAGFVELRPLLGHCKFRDCQHRSEPGCALIAAVNDGTVSAQRLDSYHSIVAELSAH